MILEALNDYYERLSADQDSGIAPPGYSLEKISYVVVLDLDGSVVSVDDIRNMNGTRAIPKDLAVPASFKRPGVGSKPFFLWDKTSYALGVGKQSDRTKQNHSAFKARHETELAKSDDPGLKALLAFLASWKPDDFTENTLFKAHGDNILDTNIAFRLDGELGYLHERPAARQLYSEIMKHNDGGNTGICLVTGSQKELARLHPSIKGIRGTQNAETSIVSFNLDAFSSYGKAQGENAPISQQVAEAYTTAINYLLRSKRQRIDIGDANVVFWAQADNPGQAAAAEDLMASFFDPPADDGQETQKLRHVLESVRQGRPLSELDPGLSEGTRMFVLGLAPNASRLSIRFWQSDTLAVFAQRLSQHYRDLELDPIPWRTPPAIWRLLLATAPSREGKAKSEDVPPQLAGELTRAILTGARYPRSLLSNLIMRFRADGDISGTRVALCKAVLARERRLGVTHSNNKEVPVSLDTTNTDPGYLLGRLFATLEGLQRAALGKQVNATIRDRYYGSASATPASIFPVVLRTAQNHLSRLRKDKPGLAINLEKEIAGIVDLLGPTFPKTLRIEAQGHFAIGYYHQTQARFTRPSADQDNNTIHSEEGEPA